MQNIYLLAYVLRFILFNLIIMQNNHILKKFIFDLGPNKGSDPSTEILWSWIWGKSFDPVVLIYRHCGQP